MAGKLRTLGISPGLTRGKNGTRSGITQVQGGENQINKQETRWGSVFGESKGMPNTTLNKYAGKKEGGLMESCKQIAAKAVKGHEKKMHKMAKGGVTRADGCVTKGRTKGKMVTMACGGMAKGKK